MAKLKIKVGKVEEFTLHGVTGVRALVQVADEQWDFRCLTPNHIIDSCDQPCEWRFKQNRWDGDWHVNDPTHIEIMQKVLTAANEKLLPYVESLRGNDNGGYATRTPD